MVYTRTIIISTQGFCDIVDITDQIQKIVKESKIKEGICSIFVLGSTAGITTMEYEDGLIRDLKEFFQKTIPQDRSYYHDKTWKEANGFSHLRASLVGPSITVSINQTELNLGTWQQIVLLNFDNRSRERKISVTLIGD